jgi:hypothetical protein
MKKKLTIAVLLLMALFNATAQTTCTVQASVTYSIGSHGRCAGKDVTLEAYPNNFTTTYLWTCPNNNCPPNFNYNASNGSFISAKNLSNNGYYIVTATDSSGCVAVDSVLVDSYEIPLAGVSMQALGLCPGDTIIFCATDTSTTSTIVSYLWDNGDTTECIYGYQSLMNYPYPPCVVTNQLGCQSTNSIIWNVMAVADFPDTTININGSLTFCHGDSVELCSNATPLTSTFLWSNGSALNCITIDSSGIYSVIITNGSGCSRNSAPISVTVYPVQIAQLTFSASNDTILSSLNGSNFIWHFSVDGITYSDIPLSFNYMPVANNGFYFLSFTDTNGCMAFSDTITRTVGFADLQNSLNLYPNPATDEIVVDLTQLNILTNATVDISDIYGRKIISLAINKNIKHKIDISHLTKGLYTLHINANTFSNSRLFVKQ